MSNKTHYIDFLGAIQNNLNAEILRIVEIRRNLIYITANRKLSELVKTELNVEIDSLLITEKKLRRQYADIETYKHEYFKEQSRQNTAFANKTETYTVDFDNRQFIVGVNNATENIVIEHYKAKEITADLARFIQPQTLPITVKMAVVEKILESVKLIEAMEFQKKHGE